MSPLAASASSAFLSSTSTLVARESIESSFDNFKDSFSSWDTCMSKAYCKWPVIAAIILASLIVLSLLLCAARCLCCGLECCFGCFVCCNACCPSPRGGSRTKYEQAPQQPWPQQPPPPPQPYTWQPHMAYGAPPETATFDAPSRNRGDPAAARAAMVGNADALPPMPSWQTAQSRRIVRDDDEIPDEETALQENGIAMGAVGASTRMSAATHSQVGFASPPAHEEDMPMLSVAQTQAQQPSHAYTDDIDTSYPPTRNAVRFASPPIPQAAPQRNPYNNLPITTSPQSRTYTPQTAYNDYTNSFGTAAPYSPVHDAPAPTPIRLNTAYAAPLTNTLTSPTDYYAPTPMSATAPVAHGAFDYAYNHSAAGSHGDRAAGIRSPVESIGVPPSYRSRAPTVEPEAQLGYGNQGAYGYEGNGNGNGTAWRRSEVARKPVGRAGSGGGGGGGGSGGANWGYGNGNGGNGRWRDV